MELAIPDAGTVWQHEKRRSHATSLKHLGPRTTQTHRQQLNAIGVAHGHLHVLGPRETASRVRIAGCEGEMLDMAGNNGELGSDNRSPRFLDPRMTPRGQVDGR